MKILIIRLKYIGDVILTTPAIRAVREHYKDCYLAYLAQKESASILEGNKNINEIISYDSGNNCFKQFGLIKNIRKKKFDIVIDFWGTSRSAFISFLSGAKLRLGFDYRFRKVFYTDIVKSSGKRLNAIEVYIDALSRIGVSAKNKKTELFLDESAENFANGFLKSNGIEQKKIVGVFPGATWEDKRWDRKKFADIINKLINHKIQVIVFEGPKEKGICEEIKKDVVGEILIASCLSLQQLASLIKRCRLLITNDAAPMHIGVAVGTKTLAIFKKGEPDIWFPYTGYGYFAFAGDVGVSEVWNKVLQFV